jgi:hypothetical protein
LGMMPSAVGAHPTGPAEEMRNNLFCPGPLETSMILLVCLAG